MAELWGVAQQTVAVYRRHLGTRLSWQQARDSQQYRESQQLRARDFVERTRQRWCRWRQEREQALATRKQELEDCDARQALRVCAVCGQQWFASKEFYHVQSRQVGKRRKTTISRTCRLCRAQQRRQRKLQKTVQRHPSRARVPRTALTRVAQAADRWM